MGCSTMRIPTKPNTEYCETIVAIVEMERAVVMCEHKNTIYDLLMQNFVWVRQVLMQI